MQDMRNMIARRGVFSFPGLHLTQHIMIMYF